MVDQLVRWCRELSLEDRFHPSASAVADGFPHLKCDGDFLGKPTETYGNLWYPMANNVNPWKPMESRKRWGWAALRDPIDLLAGVFPKSLAFLATFAAGHMSQSAVLKTQAMAKTTKTPRFFGAYHPVIKHYPPLSTVIISTINSH